jgi:hypothetical protein
VLIDAHRIECLIQIEEATKAICSRCFISAEKEIATWRVRTPCEGCGRNMVPLMPTGPSNRTTCSGPCAMRVWRRHKLKPRYQKTCTVCSRPFEAAFRNAKVCGDACWRKHRLRTSGAERSKFRQVGQQMAAGAPASALASAGGHRAVGYAILRG